MSYNYLIFLFFALDWVKMKMPSYPKIVKKPMDLAMTRKKLDNQEYTTAQKFYGDSKLTAIF